MTNQHPDDMTPDIGPNLEVPTVDTDPVRTGLRHLEAFNAALEEFDMRGDVDTVGRTVAPGVHDATIDPRDTVEQLPAVMTSMSPAQFNAWVQSDGDMFVVYLPGQKSFIMKVPADHNAFFVALLQQVKFALGPEVQAIRMSVMSGPPADVDAGTATQAPDWAQPTECPEMDGCTAHDADGNTIDRECNPDGSCAGCGVGVDMVHERTCPVWRSHRDTTKPLCRGSNTEPFPGSLDARATTGACTVCNRRYPTTEPFGRIRAHTRPPMRDSDSHGF